MVEHVLSTFITLFIVYKIRTSLKIQGRALYFNAHCVGKLLNFVGILSLDNFIRRLKIETRNI